MPYLDLNDEKTTVRALHRALKKYGLSPRLIRKGLAEGFRRLDRFH